MSIRSSTVGCRRDVSSGSCQKTMLSWTIDLWLPLIQISARETGLGYHSWLVHNSRPALSCMKGISGDLSRGEDDRFAAWCLVRPKGFVEGESSGFVIYTERGASSFITLNRGGGARPMSPETYSTRSFLCLLTKRGREFMLAFYRAKSALTV